MAQFTVDKRDFEFVLFEQLKLEELATSTSFTEMRRDDFEMILAEGIRLATEVLGPINAIGDAEGSRLVNGQVIWPKSFVDAYKKFVEGGWIALAQSTEHGGMGLPFPLAVAVTELFVGACSSFIFLPGLTASAGHLLEAFAKPSLRDMLVPRMYSGQWAGTMCLTEPQAGSDVGALTTSATPVPGQEGTYTIKGNKIFISAGDNNVTENIIHLVLARVPGDPAGTKGISLFAVPKRRYDQNGTLGVHNDVAVTAIEHKMGIHASPTCALSFGDNDACEGYLIGERCQGIVYMFQMMNEARILCGVQGAGCANASYQLALTYAKERVQGADTKNPHGGSTTIINHPDVRRNLMLAKSYSEGIRALVLKTAYYAEVARNHTDAAMRSQAKDLLDLLTPLCKAFVTDKGFKVTELAIQIHGGYGYVREYGVEQCMRDVKIASIYEGTNGIQALDLLGRKMRLRDGALFLTWLQEINGFLQQHTDHACLKDEVAKVDKVKNALAETAMGLGQVGAKDLSGALLKATPFLEMFGYVEVARLLLEQALIADAKLYQEPKVAMSDAETKFYDGKIKSARFFIHNVLPQAYAVAKEIQSTDRSALEMVW